MTRKRLVAAALIVAALAVLASPGLRLGALSSGKPVAAYLTQPVTRGDIARSISASGTLTPVNVVQVGTQVSGTIQAIHVDFNSPVKPGQLLAKLDPQTLDAELASSRAALQSAQASLKLAREQIDRNRSLFDKGFVTRSELEQSQERFDTAAAQVRQQQAALQRSATGRANAEIRSPVSGVVMSRDVSVGQTVQASFSTPTLFKIAQDLRQMQIEASVSEADIALVREGQKASFTVDAYPDHDFSGTVEQVRNNYTVQQNVVTYTVVLHTDNGQLLLRPGMTGYVKVDIARRAGVLRIPNAALRYEGPGAKANADETHGGTRTVWRLIGGAPQAVEVAIGTSDGRNTELVSGALHEGDALVIGAPPQDNGPMGPKIF